MKTRIVGLELDEVSFVGDPANPLAKVLLLKRGVKKDALDEKREAYTSALKDKITEAMADAKTPGELQRALDSCFQEFYKAAKSKPKEAITMPLDLSAVSKEVQDFVAKLQADLKAAEELIAEAEAKLAAAPKPEPSQADLEKSLPESVRKMVEAARAEAASAAAEVQKLRDEKEDKEFVEQAGAYPQIIAKAAEFGPIFKALSKGAPDAFPKLKELLKSVNEQMRVGKLFNTLGGDERPGGDFPEAQVAARARALVQKDAKLTIQDAYSAVFAEDPGLYERYRAATASRAS